jgi:predicted nucleotidyltransferase component of viral defense system
MNRDVKDVAASVYSRLKNIARQQNTDFQTILQYYGMERFLYRLSQTEHQRKFILKGGLIFNAWELPFRRVTKDIDFRGFTQNSLTNIEEIFQAVCLQECKPDGLLFDPDTLTLEVTQVNAEYDGIRGRLICYLGKSRISIQIDIGFSDTITPEPIVLDYPSYLPEFPSPILLGYPPETVIAEKVQAIIVLGEANSRFKDFYDIWLLSEHRDFDGAVLQQAIQRTFERRQTDYPTSLPSGLTTEFASRSQKDWERTVKDKNKLSDGKESDFKFVTKRITDFLLPPISALANGQPFKQHWKAGGVWR